MKLSKSNFRGFFQSLGDPYQIFSHLIMGDNLIFCSLKDRIRVVEAHNGNKVRHRAVVLNGNFSCVLRTDL
jgi:hypothetical protein